MAQGPEIRNEKVARVDLIVFLFVLYSEEKQGCS